MSPIQPELRKRIQTAVAGGAALLGLTLGLGVYGTLLVAVGIALAMTHEYLGMVLVSSDRNQKRQVILGVVWLVGFFSMFLPRMGFELLLGAFVGLFFYFLFTANRHSATPAELEAHLREGAYSFFGMVYLGFLPLYLPLIRGEPNGGWWLLLFFLLNWVGDSAAYFVGLRHGKRKLYPAISPKKTWEGSYGGLAGSYLITLLLKLTFFREMSWAFVVVGPALVGVTAQVGDLCESLVKRAFDKKDSGQLLPGHGGFMDRFDGLVISAPVMYFCIRLFG